jgi:hypothetical protein
MTEAQTATEPVRLEVAAPATGGRKPARWDGQRVVAACGVVGYGAPVWVVWQPDVTPGESFNRAVAEGLAAVLRAAGYGAVGVERDGE